MTKTALCRAIILTVAALCSSVVVVGCEHSQTTGGEEAGDVGGIGLQLQLGSITVNTVSYTISGNGFSRTGTIDVTGPGKTFTALLTGIPAGNNYRIDLTADSTDATQHGTGFATFNVVARTETAVSVHLVFRRVNGADPGSVLINGDANVAPYISSLTGLPLSVPVGGTSALVATATDPDNAPAALTYAWTVSGNGTVTTGAANATFTATSVGTATVTVVASDGDSTDTLTIQLAVVAAGGGGAGGTGAAGTAAAGTGGAAGTGAAGTGAAGSGAAGTGAAGTGAAGTGAAGTGAAGTGAAGTGAAGSGAAGTGAAGTGAAGTGAAGTGAAGTGAAGTGAAGTGGGVSACTTCEGTSHVDPTDGSNNTSCPDARTAGLALVGNAATGPAIGTSRAVLFQNVLDCVHTSHCAANFADSDCYCGAGVDPNACLGTGTVAATGPCKTQIEAAGESTAIADLQSRYYDPTWAVGAAFNLVETCDFVSCTTQCL